LQEKESLGHAPPAGAGCVGGEGTVQPRCRSASLHRSLGRSLICPPGPAGRLTLAGQPYQIRLLRIWRILGGGKMRQTLLRPQPRKNLFINKESFFNIGGGKIFKRCFFCFFFRR